jgi:hypothetical protein
MHKLTDPYILVLASLILLSLILFFSGQLPYPFGLVVLTLLLLARLSYLKDNRH